MLVSELENLRIRISSSLNEDFSNFCQRKKISKQDAIAGLLGWFLEQDELLQSIIVGQISENDKEKVARIILERLTEHPRLRGAVIGGREPGHPRLEPHSKIREK